ncbi:hypothetical protein D3C80_1996680 [compost metagenome]
MRFITVMTCDRVMPSGYAPNGKQNEQPLQFVKRERFMLRFISQLPVRDLGPQEETPRASSEQGINQREV